MIDISLKKHLKLQRGEMVQRGENKYGKKGVEKKMTYFPLTNMLGINT